MNHAPFIWSAYGLTAIILLWAAIAPLLRKKMVFRKIRTMKKRHSQLDQLHDTDS